MFRKLKLAIKQNKKINVYMIFYGGVGTKLDRITPEGRYTAHKNGFQRLRDFASNHKISIKIKHQFCDLGIIYCRIRKKDFYLISTNKDKIHIDNIFQSSNKIKIQDLEDPIFSELEFRI